MKTQIILSLVFTLGLNTMVLGNSNKKARHRKQHSHPLSVRIRESSPHAKYHKVAYTREEVIEILSHDMQYAALQLEVEQETASACQQLSQSDGMGLQDKLNYINEQYKAEIACHHLEEKIRNDRILILAITDPRNRKQ